MSSASPETQGRIEELLSRVRERASDRTPSPAVTGIVVQGDNDTLHIAVQTGIIAVPVRDIMHISNPISAQPDIVTLHIRNLESVRPIFPVHNLELSHLLSNAPVVVGASDTMTTVAHVTTTADPIAGVHDDDCSCMTIGDDSYD